MSAATKRPRYQRGTLRAERRWWVLRLRGEAPEEGGTRPQRSIRIGLVSEYRSRPAARLEADRRLALLGLAELQQGRRARFADYLGAYMASRVAILKKSSRAAFGTYARHLERELANKWVDEITVGVAQLLIAKLSQRGLSRPTIHSIVAFLRRVLRSARTEGIAAVMIGPRELAFPKESRARRARRCYTIEETQRILSHAEWPWRALYALQAYLGLRAGESLAIEWPHIDFAAKQIRIRQQAAHGELATLKSTNSTAALPLPDPLAAVLRSYREVWKPNQRQLLFANRQGGPLWAAGVRRNHLVRLLERLGLPPGGFHAWRHALATEAFRAGVGAAAVRQLLRHGNINTTMQYSHVEFDDLVRGSDSVAKLLTVAPEISQQCGADKAAPAVISDVSGEHALQVRSEGTSLEKGDEQVG
jgi:integrase